VGRFVPGVGLGQRLCDDVPERALRGRAEHQVADSLSGQRPREGNSSDPQRGVAVEVCRERREPLARAFQITRVEEGWSTMFGRALCVRYEVIDVFDHRVHTPRETRSRARLSKLRRAKIKPPALVSRVAGCEIVIELPSLQPNSQPQRPVGTSGETGFSAIATAVETGRDSAGISVACWHGRSLAG
jgi:hypothetical protein